ncbi:2083_t:CDS:2 [Funneliformis geosporum]|uniref:2103_t:CDS:1 n=1 Tax=Funneliformis geosporum TaxID=1117311 RepID=A0A9W4WI72_9GLOM|nr:2103_t:CDS:2 [Funneliformis geosporum]CAI2176319.1 2083_t:CDS:2 [Funneliformis geosporum]
MNKKITLILGLLSVVIPSVTLAQKTCEETFQATECSVCQKALYDDGVLSFYTGVTPPSQCATNINFGNIILEEYKNAGYDVSSPFNFTTYDVEPFKTSLDKYCALEFTCEQSEVDKTLEKIKTDCATELSAPLDLKADPKTLDITTLLAYANYLTYYGGIPTHEAICFKNEQGESCYLSTLTKLFDFAKKESNGDPNVAFSLDGKTLYLPDGTTREVPKDFVCGECWTKIAEIYLTYIEAHELDEQLETNIFGGPDKMKEELTSKCEDSTEDEGIDVVELEGVDAKRSIGEKRNARDFRRNARKFKRGGGAVTHSLLGMLRV